MRASLGAGRERLIRYWLTEGLVLSLLGAAAGAVLSAGLLPLFRSFVPSEVPRGDEISAGARLLMGSAVAETATAMLALLSPALHGCRVDLASGLKNASGSISAKRWRSVFVALQAGLATALLISAVLLLASFWLLHHVDLGFEGNQMVTAEIRLLDRNYFANQAGARFQQELLERVRAVPGVLEAGITSAVSLRGVDWLRSVHKIGESNEYQANQREVDAAYFSIMHLTLLHGRFLTDRDTSASLRVAVVSEGLARRAFGEEDPIGKQLDADEGAVTIVGEVNDVRYVAMNEAPVPAIYVPKAQVPSELVSLVLRTAHRDLKIGALLRRAVHDIDPTVPLMGVTTRSVVERRRKMAIRLALGARGRELVGLVVGQGLMPVFAGRAIGTWAAWFGAQMLGAFLFEVKPHEPVVFCGSVEFALAVAALACLVPANRVRNLAPALALQSEGGLFNLYRRLPV